jgi:hypothetical protein
VLGDTVRPEVAAAMANMNFMPPPIKSRAEFGDIVARDLQAWKEIAADSDIRLDN